MNFNWEKAKTKLGKGLLAGGLAAAVSGGLVWGLSDTIPLLVGNEEVVTVMLTGALTSLFEFLRNTWKHR